MKKLYSLIKACMTSDMNIFKIKTNKSKSSKKFIPIFIALWLMFVIWSNANIIMEKMVTYNLQTVILSLSIFGVSLMTIIEGIYKTGSLVFNARDDDLLLSLPIKRGTVLFIRLFKFYVFELIFNSLFVVPLVIAYIRWGEIEPITYIITNIVMLLTLPIIPIVISCLIGFLTASISSKFKYKNIVEITLSMIILLGVLYLSFNINSVFNYLVEHATSMNDIITKLYYPAGMYAKLITNFNVIDLIVFILINALIFIIMILILSKFYFSINSRLKNVTTKKTNINKLSIKANSVYYSLIKKELNIFFKTPVFIINAGFGLVLFIVTTIIIIINFDNIIPVITSQEGIDISKEMIYNNTAILVFMLIAFSSFMTSITNSVISLEGRNINVIKALPVETKTILMSKIYSSLVLTTPVLLIGTIILIIKLKIGLIESVLLLMLTISMPLISHFIGIIVNLKYPKLEFESTSEVVKQSASSFISVIVGMLLFVITMMITLNVIGLIQQTLLLVIITTVCLIIDFILYTYLIKIGVKEFNNLSV